MTKARKQTSHTSSSHDALSLVPHVVDVPLSPHWAFVVQFRATQEGVVYEAGRVEHLVSGRTSHFQSLEELRVFLSRELRSTEGVRK